MAILERTISDLRKRVSNERHHDVESADLDLLYVEEIDKKIPVFNLRNLNAHASIGRMIANQSQMALFGGVWGGFKGVKRATVNESFFQRVKPGRPKEAKIAMMAEPSDSLQFIDWSKVHPRFRYFRDYWEYKKLWESHGAFLHIIAPLKQTFRCLPDIFETTPEDFKSRYPQQKAINVSTACFIWREDPYLKHLVSWVKRSSHTDVFVGVSTLNRHGEEPPYSYQEFVDQIKDGRTDPKDIDLVVRDSIYENSPALGSHTQLRFPLVDEEPTLKVVRIGSLSPDGFTQATGLECEILPGIKDVRKNPGQNIDKQLLLMSREINDNWRKESPQLYFRN